MKIFMIASGASLVLLTLAMVEGGMTDPQKGQDCVRDSSLQECLNLSLSLPIGVVCSNCRYLIEEYADRCVNKTASDLDIRQGVVMLCRGVHVSITNDSSCDPSSPLPLCVCIATESGFIEDNEFCTNCILELEMYSNNCQTDCFNTTTEQFYRNTITNVCVDEMLPAEDSCTFDSELYVCLTRAKEITSFEYDPNNFVCTNCRSDLEEFSENCLDGFPQLVIRDNLNELCGELSSDATTTVGATDATTTVGASVLSTFSAVLMVAVVPVHG